MSTIIVITKMVLLHKTKCDNCRILNYDKARVDSLQNLLLDEDHGFAFTLLDALLFQFFASVHFAGGSNLTGTNFAESALAQHSVHPKCLVSYWLTGNRRIAIISYQHKWKRIIDGRNSTSPAISTEDIDGRTWNFGIH